MLSPLYIVGVLTPIFLIWSFLSRSFKRKYRSPLGDFLFGLWGTLIIINSLLILLNSFSMSMMGNAIKYITPVMLFFYMRHIISSRKDLHGLLQAILIGCIFPALVFVYEKLVGPIAPEYLTESRGGGARVQGAYADVMSYATYVVGSFITASYFFIQKVNQGIETRRDYILIGIVILLDIGALIAIKQVSTFIVFGTIMSIFLFYLLRNRRMTGLLLLIVPAVLLSSKFIYERNLRPLVDKEIRVIEGDAEVDRSFNGRMTRWRKYFELWGEMPGYTLVVGVAPSGFKEAPTMMGGGMHSDFVRILFFTGFGGLILYLMFLFMMFIKARWLNKHDRYLILVTLAALMLHSVSTTPFLYASYTFLLMIVFAYTLLPLNILHSE